MNLEPIRPLATEFVDGGFQMKQLQRTDNVVLFSQSKDGTFVSYEVAIIRVAPARTFPGGRTSPRREVYPGSSTWGTLAWSCATLERAQERFEELLNRPNLRRIGVTVAGLSTEP